MFCVLYITSLEVKDFNDGDCLGIQEKRLMRACSALALCLHMITAASCDSKKTPLHCYWLAPSSNFPSFSTTFGCEFFSAIQCNDEHITGSKSMSVEKDREERRRRACDRCGLGNAQALSRRFAKDSIDRVLVSIAKYKTDAAAERHNSTTDSALYRF